MVLLNVVTLQSHFSNEPFAIKHEGLENLRVAEYLKERQWYYLILLLGDKLGNEFINQLDNSIPQNSTVLKWQNLHNQIIEYLQRVLYVDTIRYVITVNSNGVVYENDTFKKITMLERTVFNEGIKIGKIVQEEIVKNSNDFNVSCVCELGSLHYWVI